MNDILDPGEPAFERLFYSEDDFRIINVGYNDFSEVAPVTHPRMQSFYTLHYVLSGKGTLDLGGKQYPLRGGHIFFLPPSVQFMYYPDSEDPWRYIWFAFNGDGADKYGTVMGFSADRPVKKAPDGTRIFMCIEKLFQDLKSISGGYYMALSAFYEIVHLCSEDNSFEGVGNAKRLIDENYSSGSFNIEALCSALAVSHSHLCRKFKKEYGTTAHKYLISRRLLLACQLLEATELSVKTVAFSSGFRDDIHFMKSFKASFGLSPTEYRKKYR